MIHSTVLSYLFETCLKTCGFFTVFLRTASVELGGGWCRHGLDAAANQSKQLPPARCC